MIHVASPYPDRAPSNPDDLIKPAVEGTQAVLRAVSEAGGVKRVVLTSSIAAVYDSSIPMPKEKEESKTFDEESWTDVENSSVDLYAKSKTLAEKAAWDFVKELPEEKRFELAVINPGMVIGPLLSKRYTTSHVAIKKLLDKSAPAYPKLNCNITDVRDVAQAHLVALTSPEAAGKRHLVVNHSVWMKDLAAIIQKELRPKGYFVPSLTAPNFLVRVSSFVDRGVKIVVPRLGREVKYDNKRVRVRCASRIASLLPASCFPASPSFFRMSSSCLSLGSREQIGSRERRAAHANLFRHHTRNDESRSTRLSSLSAEPQARLLLPPPSPSSQSRALYLCSFSCLVSLSHSLNHTLSAATRERERRGEGGGRRQEELQRSGWREQVRGKRLELEFPPTK